jgi:Tfp pilus assembly protein PilX
MAKASKTRGSEVMRIDTTGSDGMKNARLQMKGFTLIATLLMLLLLSGIAIGLMMMVNTEGRVGGTDMQNNLAFHAAEGGIEKMYSDLSAVFQNSQAPTASQICGVGAAANEPSMVGVTWTQYSVTPGTLQESSCPTTLTTTWGLISSGPNAGLYAQIIPVNMLATASLMGGQEVSMTRQAQVALIPVFQFGVFSDSDLSFFSGPNFDLVGPVHTNGDLYPFVGPGSTLTFHNQVSAYGNVVRDQLANGYNPSTNYNGTVDVPTAANGCSTATTNCSAMGSPFTSSPYGDGSVQGAGGNPPQSTYNTSTWNSFSNATNLQLINGNYGSKTTPGTGAKILSMPFVSGTNFPYQIIRQPTSSDSTALSQSREYNMAQIHVLLSDNPAELPGGASDSNNVRLANITSTQATLQGGSAAATNPWGIKIASGNYVSGTFGTATSGNTYNLYFAAASNAVPNNTCSGNTCAADWPYAPARWTANPSPTLEGLQPATLAPIYLNNGATPTIALCPPTGYTGTWPAGCPTTPAYPYYALPNPYTPVVSSALTPYNSANSNAWSLIDGYLRVEYLNTSNQWIAVTNEWLGLGFARSITPPTSPGPSTNAGSNPINPNAILLLQEPADRNGNGSVTSTATAPTCTSTTGCSTYGGGAPPEVVTDLAANTAGLTADWAFGLTPTSPTTTTPQSITQYNWYPINFYDAREGEVRDNTVANNSCSTNGVMNAVEIDVGNLKR